MDRNLYRQQTSRFWSLIGISVTALVISAIVCILASVLLNRVDNVLSRYNNANSVAVNTSCPSQPSIDTRRTAAYVLRNQRSYAHYADQVECHENNGDEALYSTTRAASYSKGMPHDALGHVDPAAYTLFLKAVQSGQPADFDAIPKSPTALASRDFTNPQAGLGFVLQGGDPPSFHQIPAPTFASAEQAGEMVENYWMAYTRDVPFHEYATDPKTIAAAAALNQLSDFRGVVPVTTANLFRGLSPGCLDGPYMSQFLLMPCTFGANTIDQTLNPPTPGVDFMLNFTTYLAQQNGEAIEAPLTYDPTARYIFTGRDLSHWVHVDVLFQAYFHAMLALMQMGAPLKSSIPYQTTELNQMGFGTFGGPDVAAFSTISATSALKSVWFQKWFVHRRLRPEVFAARVHNHKTGAYTYDLHSDVLNANILTTLFAQHGSYLLPQAFPEGSPLHPSYGAGHATVAGAAVTILKAMFQEDWEIPNPVMPNPADGGETLVPLSPVVPLTVGGELNKVANNVAIGRNIAGVHWRSDATESLRLGEEVAIQILRDLRHTYPEPFSGFTFVNFEGDTINV